MNKAAGILSKLAELKGGLKLLRTGAKAGGRYVFGDQPPMRVAGPIMAAAAGGTVLGSALSHKDKHQDESEANGEKTAEEQTIERLDNVKRRVRFRRRRPVKLMVEP